MAQVPASEEYAAAIQYLYSRINYEQTPPVQQRPRKLSMDNMRRLLSRLGDPHLRIPAIHIAGTKGKGSTAAMVHSVLTRAGYRTALYTSPHLTRLEERFVVGRELCTPEELVALTETIRPVVAEVDRELQQASPRSALTFFEVTTAMAWLLFARREAEIAVVEVGMGGRLDSTNLCRPLACVITSISFDHTKQLGNTLAAIAREKGGIIKPGVPVFSGVENPEARAVIQQLARQRGSAMYSLGGDFRIESSEQSEEDGSSQPAPLDYREHIAGQERRLTGVRIGLLGRHQVANAAVALATLGEVQRLGWNIAEEAIRSGLAEARCPARIEVVSRRPTVILDTAHNVASIQALVQTLNDDFPSGKRVLVFAASRDKDVRGMLQLILPAFDQVVCTQFIHNPRAVASADLCGMARELSGTQHRNRGPLEIRESHDPLDAWQQAEALLGPDDLACITGSFFLAAEVKPLLSRPLAERQAHGE